MFVKWQIHWSASLHAIVKCSLFPFFLLAIRCGVGRALNLTVPLGSGRVGSDDLGYRPGSGFSFEPVQTSNPSAVYLQCEIQTSKHRQTRLDLNRLDMKQTWYDMNGLDSPTAGNNINTRPGTRQWHGYLYKQTGSHDMNKPMRAWHNEQGNQ